MRIAIIGAGVSGLTVAHLLHGAHELVIYEANDYAGGHTRTFRIDEPDRTLHVDTGFIVFNDRNYPNFERLLARLGVGWRPSDMGFSVSDESGDFEYAGNSPNALYAKRSHLVTPWFHRMVADLVRFNHLARRLLGSDSDESLRHWLARHRFGRPFVERLIVPQASAVWSADPAQMWSFPARFLAEFFANHGMLGFTDRPQWRVVEGGSARYVEALVAPLASSLRLSSPVETIERAGDHVRVWSRGLDPETFDHVVIAAHADEALALLSDAREVEHELLSAIPYQPNQAVLHTDRRLLPRRRRAWASWNYHLLAQPKTCATVTYHMNRLQSLATDHDYCVTLNRAEAIDPGSILRVVDFAHPVFTPAGLAAQRRLAEISGHDRTHFCGAYWRWGFHEDGVVSALQVARRFGAGL